jgi:membrane associated rhomboid family serine protease
VIIPLGINHVIRGWPRVTIAIIVACVAMQLASTFVGPSETEIQTYARMHAAELAQAIDDNAATTDVDALVDRMVDDVYDYASSNPAYRFGYRPKQGLSYRLLTYAFAHGGWLHLIGNMLFLWLAGAALEDRWGRARFAAFYGAGAVVAGVGFALLGANPQTLLVGASGAVAALMGAFLILFAKTEIHIVYFLVVRWGRIDVKAYLALPLWLLSQVLYAKTNSVEAGSSVAYTAHIVGFIFGVAVAWLTLLFERISSQPAASQHSAVTSHRKPETATAPMPAPVPRPVSIPAPLQVIATAPPPRPISTSSEPAEDAASVSDGPKFLR